MKQLIGLLLSIGLFTSYLGASNDLVTVPAAKMESAGYLELGSFLNYNSDVGSVEDINENSILADFYLRMVFTDNFEYNLKVDHDMTTLHNLHVGFLNRYNKESNRRHQFGVGVKNLGWVSTSADEDATILPILDAYGIYNLSNGDRSTNFNVGISTDRANPSNVLLLAGYQKTSEFGDFIAEWNGLALNLGIKYKIGDYHLNLGWTASRPSGSLDDTLIRRYSIGLSYSMNVVDSLIGTLVSKKEMDDSVKRLHDRLSELESDMEYKEHVETVNNRHQFLDNMRDTFDDTIAQPTTSRQALAIKRAFLHMQNGINYYYANSLEEALHEFKLVVEMMPFSTYAHKRLGSLYYELNDIDNAKIHWKKALELDPNDYELKSFIEDIDVAIEQKEHEEILEKIESPEPEKSEPKKEKKKKEKKKKKKKEKQAPEKTEESILDLEFDE